MQKKKLWINREQGNSTMHLTAVGVGRVIEKISQNKTTTSLSSLHEFNKQKAKRSALRLHGESPTPLLSQLYAA